MEKTEKKNVDNYEDLCRLCASYDAIKMDIFSESGRERKLVDKITTCLPFEVSEDDLFPKSLCFRCIYNLENFYDFRRGCIDARAKLETAIRKTIIEGKDDFGSDYFLSRNKNQHEECTDFEEEPPNPADFLEACLVSGESPRENQNKHEDDEGTYNCKTCGRLFNSKSSLTIHAKFHQDQNKDPESYSCFVCEKVFSSKGHLALHSRVHIGETSAPPLSMTTNRPSPTQIRLYRCDLCSKSYSMAKHLWGHVSTCHKGDPLVTCALCFRTFSSISNLEDHKRVKHKDDLELSSKESTEEGEMTDAVKEESTSNKRKSSKPRKIERESSEAAYNSDDNMVIDESADSQPSDEPQMLYSCLLCQEKFAETQVLSEHLLNVHGYDGTLDFNNARTETGENDYAERMMEAETVFCCEICIREFNDRASLWLHMLYSHRDEASKACGICLKICEDNESLSQHVEACHPRNKTEQRRYSCQVCARQHDSRKKLVTHAKIHKLTDTQGNLIDPETVVVLNSEFYANEMLASAHDDGFMSSCDVCFKVFESESKLNKHKRSAHKDSSLNLSSSGGYHFFFACELCGLSHLTRSERWSHMATNHYGDPSVTCEVEECAKVFPTSAVKKEHESHHHLQGLYPNTCEVCGKMWKTRIEYWKHMMGVHPDCLPFICGVCLKVHCNISSLVNHVRSLHWPLQGADFSCDICGRPYSKVSKMTRHRKVHYVLNMPPEIQVLLENPVVENEQHFMEHPKKLTCDLCQNNEEFENIESLGKHRFENHEVMPCDLCTKYYGRTSHLWKHVNKIHKGHPDVTCPICEKTSASKSHLATHVAKHHRSENQEESGVSSSTPGVHTCDKCSKIFRQESLVRKHIKHCRGPQPPLMPLPPPVNGMYTCERCAKSFPAQNLLYKHMRSSHLTYTCEICLMKVNSKSDLYKHICNSHGDHPDVKCSFPDCGKILRTSFDLNRHQRDHRQSVQFYICIFCAEMVTSKLKMKKHLKSNHAKDTRYLCAICLKPLSSFKELKSHVEENHKSALDRPNTCPVCGKPCSNKSKLMEHIRSHSIYFHPCKICLKILPTKDDLNLHLNNHPSDNEDEDHIDEVELDANSIMDIIGAQKGETICVKRQLDDESEKEETITVPAFKKIKTEFSCDICSETFIFMDDFIIHKETHVEKPIPSILEAALIEVKQEKLDQVEIVEKVVIKEKEDFVQQSYTTTLDAERKVRNNRKVYSDDFTPSMCEICGKVWPAKRHLWQHLIRFHRLQAGTSCGICLKLCTSFIDLSNHLVLEHPKNFDCDGTNLSCRVCGKYHNARSKLQNHAMIHTGHEERAQRSSHHCLICDTSFPLFKLFCEHTLTAHDLTSQYVEKHHPVAEAKIESCNGTENSKFPFNSCDVCSLVFASEQGLINHKRIHTQSDNYKCGQCGELFNSATLLSTHKTEKHRAEFVCADCKSNFSTYLQLIEHNKVCNAKLRNIIKDEPEEEQEEEQDDDDEEEEIVEEEDEMDDDPIGSEEGEENEEETQCDNIDDSSISDEEKSDSYSSSSEEAEFDDEYDEKVTQEEPRAIEAYVCDNMVEVVKVDISETNEN